jgi:hypothetical protein
MVTEQQKEIAERLVESLKDIDPEEIRQNIREENEYMKRKEEAQKPTRDQMQRRFNI